MIDVLWIFLILGVAYLLFIWLPGYFRRRNQRSQREVLDLKFNEDPREPPVSTSRTTILRGMVIVAALLVIAALVFRSMDLVYVIVVWVLPMLIVNNWSRIVRWFKDLGK